MILINDQTNAKNCKKFEERVFGFSIDDSITKKIANANLTHISKSVLFSLTALCERVAMISLDSCNYYETLIYNIKDHKSFTISSNIDGDATNCAYTFDYYDNFNNIDSVYKIRCIDLGVVNPISCGGLEVDPDTYGDIFVEAHILVSLMYSAIKNFSNKHGLSTTNLIENNKSDINAIKLVNCPNNYYDSIIAYSDLFILYGINNYNDDTSEYDVYYHLLPIPDFLWFCDVNNKLSEFLQVLKNQNEIPYMSLYDLLYDDRALQTISMRNINTIINCVSPLYARISNEVDANNNAFKVQLFKSNTITIDDYSDMINEVTKMIRLGDLFTVSEIIIALLALQNHYTNFADFRKNSMDIKYNLIKK